MTESEARAVARLEVGGGSFLMMVRKTQASFEPVFETLHGAFLTAAGISVQILGAQ